MALSSADIIFYLEHKILQFHDYGMVIPATITKIEIFTYFILTSRKQINLEVWELNNWDTIGIKDAYNLAGT